MQNLRGPAEGFQGPKHEHYVACSEATSLGKHLPKVGSEVKPITSPPPKKSTPQVSAKKAADAVEPHPRLTDVLPRLPTKGEAPREKKESS